MTFEQLIEITTANTVAISHTNAALAGLQKAQAENAVAIAQLTSNIHALHTDMLTLEKALVSLTATVAATERQWQAYINTLPKN